MLIPLSNIIYTERLKLRAPLKEDFQHIFSATQVKGFNDGMLWEPLTDPSECELPYESGLNAWRNGEGYGFAIVDKVSAAFLGRISIRKTKTASVWNVGFWTHPDYQRKGIMTEALAAVLDFGFTSLSASRIEAEYATWNIASEKTLKNNGLQFAAFIEKGFQKNGQWIAENRYYIDKASWLKR